MKKICNILICVIIASVGLVSCDDILNVDSERLTFETDYQMQSPNDTIYSMAGIYSQLQKLADSYVLLGELRADLMDVTVNSNLDLREINDFEISKNNSYVNIKDYYSVINNCNYVIQNLDTASIIKGEKVMKGYYAVVKGIRAWTYMQIALNFGTAKYYDKPILTLADAEADYPEYNIEQLAEVLIPDLTPLKDEETPNILRNSGGSKVFPIHFILGDLYLWTGQYKEAANEYHELMYKNRLIIDKEYRISYVLNNLLITSNYQDYWANAFYYRGTEAITSILCPTTYGQRFELDSLNYNYEFTPSAIALNNWDNQTYFNTAANTAPGDLRKEGSVIDMNAYSSFGSGTTTGSTSQTEKNIVYKYLVNQQTVNVQNVLVYRSSLLYLRYAEAVNRMGKPNLAFAVLKNGLNSITMSPTKKLIPTRERTGETFLNFSDFRFDNNVGIRSRGLGPNIDKDSTYIIPQAISDSLHVPEAVLYVEDLIQQEIALETAFEGNRFHDLMRLTLRRIKNGEGDESYLADKIAAKHIGNEAGMKSKLMNQTNWYVKK